MPEHPQGTCKRDLRKLVGAMAVLVATMIATSSSQAQPQKPSPLPSAEDLAVLKEAYRRPAAKPVENPQLVDLGRHLFWDPRLSASGKTTCVGCHLPYLGWAATDARSRSDSGRPTSRKSQPLIGIGHAENPLVGWDGRNKDLEAQVKSSIEGGSMSMKGTDAPVDVATIAARIQAVPDYVAMFAAAMPGTAIDINSIAKAIAHYERHIEPGIAPFDRWVEGDESAISDSAKRGFVLFNGSANCVACHGGWRFTDDNFHDIGTATGGDRGRGNEMKDDAAMQFAFKTPTLRSVALRPPYMHNASAATLYDVIRHYEKGGIDRPSRSPAMMPLDLSEQDRLDLVAFMQTLTGLPEGEAPPKLPGLQSAAR